MLTSFSGCRLSHPPEKFKEEWICYDISKYLKLSTKQSTFWIVPRDHFESDSSLGGGLNEPNYSIPVASDPIIQTSNGNSNFETTQANSDRCPIWLLPKRFRKLLTKKTPWWSRQKFWLFGNREIGVSQNGGTPKSSILVGFSLINHPAIGEPPFMNHLWKPSNSKRYRVWMKQSDSLQPLWLGNWCFWMSTVDARVRSLMIFGHNLAAVA